MKTFHREILSAMLTQHAQLLTNCSHFRATAKVYTIDSIGVSASS